MVLIKDSKLLRMKKRLFGVVFKYPVNRLMGGKVCSLSIIVFIKYFLRDTMFFSMFQIHEKSIL